MRERPDLDYVSLIVRTGAQRLRPVLLTHGDHDLRTVPLSQAIVSGLSFATLLTLVATPTIGLYVLRFHFQGRTVAQ